jgi:nucleoside-diphosphate-sugar epimerase
MEHIAKTYFDRLNILLVRPFNYTGPKQGEHFLIPKIIAHYKKKKSSIELGNINVAREFNDIRYVVDVYYHLLHSSVSSDTVNLCTGKAWELSEIINLLDAMAGYKIEVNVNPAFCRENEISVLKGSALKLHSIVGNVEHYSMKETLSYMLGS